MHTGAAYSRGLEINIKCAFKGNENKKIAFRFFQKIHQGNNGPQVGNHCQSRTIFVYATHILVCVVHPSYSNFPALKFIFISKISFSVFYSIWYRLLQSCALWSQKEIAQSLLEEKVLLVIYMILWLKAIVESVGFKEFSKANLISINSKTNACVARTQQPNLLFSASKQFLFCLFL